MRIGRHHDAYIVVVGAVLSGTVGLGPDIVEVEESRPSAEMVEYVGKLLRLLLWNITDTRYLVVCGHALYELYCMCKRMVPA